jgi:resuscitation-promoting factor RpfB
MSAASLPAAISPDGVDMWVKVRRGGLSALVVLTGASLLQTSIPMAMAFAAKGRTLNLRVLGRREDGATVGAWVLAKAQPAALRAAHALTADPSAPFAPSLDSGQVIVVTVRVGVGSKRLVLTNAATVDGVLGALGVQLRRLDRVKPAADSVLLAGARVTVTRIRRYRRTELVPVPFETLIQYSKELAAGEVTVVTPGTPGEAQVTYLVTRRNGKEVSRRVLANVVVAQPVSQVEQHGTAPPVQGGVEYGDATWYSWTGCGSGYHAAHKSLPFGTVVTVTNLDNGKSVTVTINDRGPYIAGRIIDLCPTAFSALAPLGQGVAHVRIRW